MADRTSYMRNSTMSSFTTKTQMFTTFNNATKLGPHRIEMIKKEGEMLSEADEVCRKIWDDMRTGEINPKEIMSFETFQIVFESNQRRLNDILGVLSVKEMFELLDEDNDGFLNEDEQILLFSLVKAKMLKCSKDLLVIYDYEQFHTLMSRIRKLESYITQWQDFLRSKIYSGELVQYKEIGFDKLEEFLMKYEKKFHEFFESKNNREREFELRRSYEREQLERELENDSHAVKFKPKKQLREYQTQERLVALEERIEEATNFRKELKDLEVSEAERLSKLWYEFREAELKKFDHQTMKLRSHMQVKLNNEENKLVIKLSKDFDILVKKIALHENDIKRIQTLTKKKAITKGRSKGEIFRLKDTLRYQNEIIQKSKKVKPSMPTVDKDATQNTINSQPKSQMSELNSPQSQSLQKKLGSKLPMINGVPERKKMALRNLQKLKKQPDMIRFYIRHKFKDEMPGNTQTPNYQQGEEDHTKIEKYLEGKKNEDDGVIKLTAFYDDFLEEKTEKEKRDYLKEPEPQPETATRRYIIEVLKKFHPHLARHLNNDHFRDARRR